MKPLVIHQTDLFHSYNDPDDHWDLACQYALAFNRDINLAGILIDYPPIVYGDPAIQAINQLNYITGLSVPVAIGLSEPVKDIKAIYQNDGYATELSGINLLLRSLEDAKEPVFIHIVGSCRDVAAAVSLRPELFKEKCGGIYLNAGSSNPNSKLEYNVNIDPYSYSVIFGLECPIYWLPCFEFSPEPPEWEFKVGTHGTFYRFIQEEILPELSENVQKYFLYALDKNTDNKWLSYLKNPLNKRLLDFHCTQNRSMYSTAGFLHCAGKTVTRAGKLADLNENRTDTLYTFEPVEASCDEKGFVSWRRSSGEGNRYIIKIKDLEGYAAAMTLAMKELLKKLP